jgi:hypothetical protein
MGGRGESSKISKLRIILELNKTMGMLTNNQKQHKKTTSMELWEKPRRKQQLWELWKNP